MASEKAELPGIMAVSALCRRNQGWAFPDSKPHGLAAQRLQDSIYLERLWGPEHTKQMDGWKS